MLPRPLQDGDGPGRCSARLAASTSFEPLPPPVREGDVLTVASLPPGVCVRPASPTTASGCRTRRAHLEARRRAVLARSSPSSPRSSRGSGDAYFQPTVPRSAARSSSTSPRPDLRLCVGAPPPRSSRWTGTWHDRVGDNGPGRRLARVVSSHDALGARAPGGGAGEHARAATWPTHVVTSNRAREARR